MPSKSTFRVYDHFMRPLDHIDAPSTPRSWVLNGFGKNEFTVGLPYLSERFGGKEETILQYNNLVFIEHNPSKDANGTLGGKLPDWVGVILPDRGWTLARLGCNCYSAESILKFRPLAFKKIEGTPKAIFLEILEHARLIADDIVIQPGTVDDIPETFSDNFVTSAYDHIQKLCTRAGMNWDVTGQIDSRGNLQLYANLYARKGTDTRLILNEDNSEADAETPLMTEQGTPYNVVYGFSQSSTEKDRKMAIGRNQESIDKFGTLAINHVFSGITDLAGLRNASQAMADALAFPQKITRRVVLDKGLAFDNLRVGNTVIVKDNNVGFKRGGGFGFETTARIMSLDYNDLTNKAPIHLEVL